MENYVMDSFIKVCADISNNSLTVLSEWYQHAQTTYQQLSLLNKCKHLVRQSFALNYLKLVYDNNPGLLINLYANSVADLVADLRREMQSANMSPDERAMGRRAITICEWLLRRKPQLELDTPKAFNNNDVVFFLTKDISGIDAIVPTVMPPSCYLPYLHFITTTGKLTPEAKGRQFVATDNLIYQNAMVPTVGIVGRTIVFDYIPVPKYDFNAKAVNELIGESGTPFNFHRSFYSYLLCHDLSGFSVSQMLGFLASNAYELDPEDQSKQAIGSVYTGLYSILFNWRPCGVVPRITAGFQFRQLIHFIIQLRTLQGCLIDDQHVLASLLANTTDRLTEREQQLIQYFNNEESAVLSVESYTAFKESIFSRFPELNTKSHLVKAGMEADNTNEADKKDDNAIDDTNVKDNSDDTDSTDTGDDSTGIGNADDPADSPDDAMSSDPSEDSTSTDPGASGTEPNANTPPTLNTSDPAGIELKIGEAETLDTYLFRTEVGNNIDNVLSNQPANTNNRDILVLKKIRSMWLNILSIKTLCDILAHVKFKVLPVNVTKT